MRLQHHLCAGLVLALWLSADAASAVSPTQSHWVGSWGASQQIPEPRNALPAEELTDATVRQLVHLSVGGERIRVRVSNAFGVAPLAITALHVARSRTKGSAAIIPGSDRALTFEGRRDVVVPAGADYWSDPADLAVASGEDLSVSLHLDASPQVQTSHPGARATTFLVHGDHTADLDLLGAKTVEHWFQLSGVDVIAGLPASSVVVLGDSITDGHGATTNGDDRWPDVLAARLRTQGRLVGVLNMGIGGNRLLLDGLGPNATARLDRDVLAQDGVRTVIVLEGVNDLGVFAREGSLSPADHAALVQRLETAYAQLVSACRQHNLKVIGATILPFRGATAYTAGPEGEQDWLAINRWIRSSGQFDSVVDFARLMADSSDPMRLNPAYDSGDHLHPSPQGYRRMAESINLSAIQ